jgi:hypothetical protein
MGTNVVVPNIVFIICFWAFHFCSMYFGGVVVRPNLKSFMMKETLSICGMIIFGSMTLALGLL